MEQIGEKLMINLLIKLEDSKREMVEKLNHVKIQTKSYAKSVQNSSQEKNQTPNGRYIDFCAIMEETKMKNQFIKKRRIIDIMHTNGDQYTTIKRFELL